MDKFIHRMPAWVFWPLYVTLLTCTVASAIGLRLHNTAPSPSAPEPVTSHERI